MLGKMRSEVFMFPNYKTNQLKRATRRLFAGKGLFDNSQEAESFYSTFVDSLINYDCQLPSSTLPVMKRLTKWLNSNNPYRICSTLPFWGDIDTEHEGD